MIGPVKSQRLGQWSCWKKEFRISKIIPEVNLASSDLSLIIEEKTNFIINCKEFSQLSIFVEGITTNNKGLVDFRKGAFILGAPVKIYYLDYGFDFFNPTLTYISIMHNLFIMLLQYRQKITYYSLKGTYYPANFTTWKEFAKETKKLMCQYFEVPDLAGTYEQKMNAEKYYTPLNYTV